MFYAEVDQNNICSGVSILAGEVNESRMIPIESMNISLIGKKYIPCTDKSATSTEGEWEDVPQEQPIEQLTEQEIINAEILLQQTEIQMLLQNLLSEQKGVAKDE